MNAGSPPPLDTSGRVAGLGGLLGLVALAVMVFWFVLIIATGGDAPGFLPEVSGYLASLLKLLALGAIVASLVGLASSQRSWAVFGLVTAGIAFLVPVALAALFLYWLTQYGGSID